MVAELSDWSDDELVRECHLKQQLGSEAWFEYRRRSTGSTRCGPIVSSSLKCAAACWRAWKPLRLSEARRPL